MTFKVQRIPLTEEETARLIRESNGRPVDLSFGPSGVWIEYSEGSPLPWTIEALAVWRGVVTENTKGDGV